MRSDFAAAVTEFDDREWLSPTRAWRLTECAASVGPVVNAAITSITTTAPNAGTVAHRAIQLWIGASGYRDDDPRGRLTEAISAARTEFSGEPVGEWSSTRARLLARAEQLAERLRAGDQVISEQELKDNGRALRGTPDIVVVNAHEAVVIDLKTPTSKDDSVPPWVVFQLTIYAHLIEQQCGVLPRQAEVFRLNRGLMPLAVTPMSVSTALATVERAREADPSVATPATETCRYCRRRIDCQPHWDAAAFWSGSDCVEGTIDRIERAANGLAAILVRSANGLRWVSGIPSELATANAGEQIRLVRIHGSGMADGSSAFKWSRYSAMAVHAPGESA